MHFEESSQVNPIALQYDSVEGLLSEFIPDGLLQDICDRTNSAYSNKQSGGINKTRNLLEKIDSRGTQVLFRNENNDGYNTKR